MTPQDLNKLHDKERLAAVLSPDFSGNESIIRHNLAHLFPIAEAQAAKWKAWGDPDEATQWDKLAKKAAKYLGIEPDLSKRIWYGISIFHGSREVVDSKGKWTRQGGQWSVPVHGQHHSFLTEKDAQVWGDMQYGLLASWAKQRDLPCPYKVVEMGPRPIDLFLKANV